MSDPRKFEISVLDPKAIDFITRFGQSLAMLSSLLDIIATWQADTTPDKSLEVLIHDQFQYMQKYWPTEKAGRQSIQAMVEGMAADMGFLVTEADPSVQQPYLELTVVFAMIVHAMKGTDTWMPNNFRQWIDKQISTIEGAENG